MNWDQCNPTLGRRLVQEQVIREQQQQARRPAERPAPAPAKARTDAQAEKRDLRDWYAEN